MNSTNSTNRFRLSAARISFKRAARCRKVQGPRSQDLKTSGCDGFRLGTLDLGLWTNPVSTLKSILNAEYVSWVDTQAVIVIIYATSGGPGSGTKDRKSVV